MSDVPVMFSSIPVETEAEQAAFRTLLEVTGTNLEAVSANELRSYDAVLQMAEVFVEWVEDNESAAGADFGLETGADHIQTVYHGQTRVPGSGDQPPLLARLPKGTRGHGHHAHGDHHGDGHHGHASPRRRLFKPSTWSDKNLRPNYRPNELFEGSRFEGGTPEVQRRFWKVGELRIGTQGDAVNKEWMIGQKPDGSVGFFHNGGGNIRLAPNGRHLDANGRVTENPQNINQLPGLVEIDPTSNRLPDTLTTLHVLGRAARFAVQNGIDPRTFGTRPERTPSSDGSGTEITPVPSRGHGPEASHTVTRTTAASERRASSADLAEERIRLVAAAGEATHEAPEVSGAPADPFESLYDKPINETNVGGFVRAIIAGREIATSRGRIYLRQEEKSPGELVWVLYGAADGVPVEKLQTMAADTIDEDLARVFYNGKSQNLRLLRPEKSPVSATDKERPRPAKRHREAPAAPDSSRTPAPAIPEAVRDPRPPRHEKTIDELLEEL